MKKTLILLFLLLPVFAQAKVTLCKKGCAAMEADQINSIKGLLYEVSQAQEPSVKKQILPKFARCIVWLEKIHKDKKTHVIVDYNTEDASLVKASIQLIIDVAMSRHSDMPPEQTISRWTEKGAKVVAEYKETKTKDKNGNKKIKIKWKLELLIK